MKESVGYTVTLNIMFTFIIIVFAFLSAALIYFKSNKASNVIVETIEKYEGYNDYAKNEINLKLSSLGYNKRNVNCANYYNKIGAKEKPKCGTTSLTDGNDGYCIFLCSEQICDNRECNAGENGEWYYYYKVSTNMMINIPIINDMLNIPIFSNTNRMYDFEKNLG